MESWLTEALEPAADHLTLLADPLDLSVPLQLLYDQVTAYRCRLCTGLYSSIGDVTAHIELKHCHREDANYVIREEEESALAEEPLLKLAAVESMLELPPEAMLRDVTTLEGLAVEQSQPRVVDDGVSSVIPEQCVSIPKVKENVEAVDVSGPKDLQSDDVGSSVAISQDTGSVARCSAKQDIVSDESSSSSSPVNMQTTEALNTEELLDKPINSEDKRMYICSECGEISSSLKECKLHLKRIHLTRSANTDAENNQIGGRTSKFGASKAFRTAKQIDENRSSPTPEQPPKSSLCRRSGCALRFSSDDNRDMHERCHGAAKTFRCAHCPTPQPTSSWPRLKTHLWRTHAIDLDMYGCDRCPFKSAALFNAQNHRLTHADERRFVCSQCSKAFKQQSQLLNHRLVHKENGGRDAARAPAWARSQECAVCSKTFANAKSLKIHQRTVHQKAHRFMCHRCNYLTGTKSQLVLHMRVHSGETPFVCTDPSCGYRTKDPSSFRRHQRRHSGVRPYACPHAGCAYRAIQSAGLKQHVRNRHAGAGLHGCTDCNFSSINAAQLRTHRVMHERGLIDATRAAPQSDDEVDCEVDAAGAAPQSDDEVDCEGDAAGAAPQSDHDADDDGLTALVSRATPIPEVSAISGVLSGGADADGAERREYVFTVTPGSRGRRAGVRMPAGREERSRVNGLIGGAVVEPAVD